MTGTRILKDKTVNLAYRMYFECPIIKILVLKYHFSPVLLMTTQHKFCNSFYYQI